MSLRHKWLLSLSATVWAVILPLYLIAAIFLQNLIFDITSFSGKFTSWDHNPIDDGREKYIRSHMPLDDLELRARFPQVDDFGREK